MIKLYVVQVMSTRTKDQQLIAELYRGPSWLAYLEAGNKARTAKEYRGKWLRLEEDGNTKHVRIY